MPEWRKVRMTFTVTCVGDRDLPEWADGLRRWIRAELREAADLADAEVELVDCEEVPDAE